MKDGKIATKQNPDNIEKGTGTVYTTIGSTALNKDGTGDASNVEEMMLIAIPEAEQAAFTTFEVSANKLTVVTKQLNGLVLDQFSILTELSNEGGENNNGGTPGGDGNGENNGGDNGEENIPGGNTTPDGEQNNKVDATEPSVDQPTANGNETDAPTATELKKNGCGSSLALTAVVALTSLGLGVTALKKKRND